MSQYKQFSWVYLIAILVESILAGWLLSDYNSHWLIWMGSQAVTLHLGWVGSDAVVLAVAWLTGIIWVGTLSTSWPRSFQSNDMVVWTGSLALGWVLGLMLVLTLAFAKKGMEYYNLSKITSFLLLVSLTWIGLGLGWLINNWLTIN